MAILSPLKSDMDDFILRVSFESSSIKNNFSLKLCSENNIDKNNINFYKDNVVLLKYRGANKKIYEKKLGEKKYLVYASVFEEDIPAIRKMLKAPANCKRTDSELMLELYLQYGKDGLRALANGFIFILVDYTEKKVLAFRDHIGIKNICYYSHDNFIYLSSSFKNIYALDGLTFSLNSKKIKDFLEVKDRSHVNTFINEIKKVPPSFFIVYHIGDIQTFRYIKYNLKKSLRSPKEQISGLAKLLRKSILVDKSNTHSKTGFLMSGGIDPSTVICFFKSFKNSDHGIFSFSAQYKGLDSKVLHLIDESEFQDEINKSGDVHDVTFAGENESTLSKLDFYLEVIGQPFFFPNLYLPNKAFELASDKGIELMMNGNDGDSVISHGYEYYLELFFSFRWIKLLQQINSTALLNNQSRRFIFKRLVYDNISLSNFLNSSSQKKHLEVMSSSSHSKAIEIQSLLANHYGIEERYPFYNKELIVYCLNISPDLKNKHGHSRYVLKEAIKGIIPEKIRSRTSKANLGHALCLSFLQKDYELINKQFSDPNALIKNIINVEDLRRSWDDLKKNPRKYSTRSSVPSKIFSFVVLNRWLDQEEQKHRKA